MEHTPMAREELRAFMKRRDTPGLVRICTQLLWFWGACAWTLWLAQGGSGLAPVGAVVMGVALATFFPPLHESGHKTAFATPWMNSAVMWWCAVMMLQAPAFFREFHGQHHRATQDPESDPEIAAAPALLDGWPSNPLVYLSLVNGQALLLGKFMFTLSCALLPTGSSLWDKAFPFLRDSARGRIARESRLVVALIAGVVTAGLLWVPGFAWCLLAWPVAHLVLGFYLMPEHTGLPHDGTQTHRTRTVVSNAVVRWFMWNMPYHTVHHEHPAIPFHLVPDAHARLAPGIEHQSSGYLAFHGEAIMRSFGWRPKDPVAQSQE